MDVPHHGKKMTTTSSTTTELYTFEEVMDTTTAYFEGDTLAAHTWATKYALTINLMDGSRAWLEKTPTMMHHRLAREFARIERRYPNPMSEAEIFGLFDKFRYIIPQGSPMAGIGNPYRIQSLGNCFTAGTMVLTQRGAVAIEEIQLGDYVWTHQNRWREVQQLHHNPRGGRRLYNVKVFRGPSFEVTENHKFWSITKEQQSWGEGPQWNTIDKLRAGDYIAMPKGDAEDFEYEFKDLEVASSLPANPRFELISTGDMIQQVTVFSTRRKEGRPVRAKWHVDSDFCFFLGLWYGDGCVFSETKDSPQTKGITFTFGAHEEELIEFVSEYGEKLFGFPPTITNNKHLDGSVQVAFKNGLIGRVFEHLFGRGCRNKKMFKDVWTWPKEYFRHLLAGLVSSDGCVTKSGDIRIVMSNEGLIRDFFFAARKNGIPVGMSTTSVMYGGKKRSMYRLDLPKNADLVSLVRKHYDDDRLETACSRQESTSRSLEINGTIFLRIDRKEPCPTPSENVYTLGVDEDHSYCVEGVFAQNCFVVTPPEDSYGGIFRTDEQLAQLMKRRAGVGVDISKLRPRHMPTANAAGTSDGISVFMERYSNTCREVAQKGRRGAEMISCSIHHPDIEHFIDIKNELTACKACGHESRTKVTGANVSVRISDEFMHAVEGSHEFELRWPIDDPSPKFQKWVQAEDLWNKIIHNAWASAEPGVLFWDTVIQNSVPDIYAEVDERFRTTSTNPCGEIPMGLDSCRLLVINVLSFVQNPYTAAARFDWGLFEHVVMKGQRLLDDMIDLELEQIDKILAKIDSDPEDPSIKAVERDMWRSYRETAELGRRTGLGPTAIGDTLAALGIRYGSDASVETVERLYQTLALGAHRSSAILAKERGAFPLHNFDLEVRAQNPYLQRIWNVAPDIFTMEAQYGRRNISPTTTAPTGSVSLLTQTTSGIEPTFCISYTRRKKINPSDPDAKIDFVDASGDKWQEYTVLEHGPRRWSELTGDTDITQSPYYGATSADIPWEGRVRIQAAAQRWISHSISSTVNIPTDTPEEVVKSIYMAAWKQGCKGITIYRDGCRDGVLITTPKKTPESSSSLHRHDAPRRPETLPCEIHHVQVRDGGETTKWILLVGLMGDHPYEIFGGLTGDMEDLPRKESEGKIVKRSYKSGGKYDLYIGEGETEKKIADVVGTFGNPNRGAFTRLISLSLRHGAPLEYIVDQLLKDKATDMYAFSKVLARVLKKYIPDGTSSTVRGCESCGGAELRYQEGCLSCTSCGWTKCG